MVAKSTQSREGVKGQLPLAGCRDSVPAGAWGNAPTVGRLTYSKGKVKHGTLVAGSEASLRTNSRSRRSGIPQQHKKSTMKMCIRSNPEGDRRLRLFSLPSGRLRRGETLCNTKINLLKAPPHNSAARLAMSFPPSASCKFLDLPPVNLRNLHLHLTKNPFASRPPHLCGVTLNFIRRGQIHQIASTRAEEAVPVVIRKSKIHIIKMLHVKFAHLLP